MNALTHHFSNVTLPLVTFGSLNEADRLGDMWRHSLSGIREDIREIAQHRKVLSERDELIDGRWHRHSASYCIVCETNLKTALKRYIARVRTITETEAKMAELGVPFAVSSDAWEAA